MSTTTTPSIQNILAQFQTRVAAMRTKVTSTTGRTAGLGLLGTGTLAKNLGTGANIATVQSAIKTKVTSLRGSTSAGGVLGSGGLLSKFRSGTGLQGLFRQVPPQAPPASPPAKQEIARRPPATTAGSLADVSILRR